MLDVLFWQTTGYHDSIVTSLSVGRALRPMGLEVGILFDQAALLALVGDDVKTSPGLEDHRTTIDNNLRKFGLPTAVEGYIEEARAAGVHLYVCSGWCEFLGIKAKWPPYLEEKGRQDSVKLIAEAKKVIVSP